MPSRFKKIGGGNPKHEIRNPKNRGGKSFNLEVQKKIAETSNIP